MAPHVTTRPASQGSADSDLSVDGKDTAPLRSVNEASTPSLSAAERCAKIPPICVGPHSSCQKECKRFREASCPCGFAVRATVFYAEFQAGIAEAGFLKNGSKLNHVLERLLIQVVLTGFLRTHGEINFFGPHFLVLALFQNLLIAHIERRT